MELEILTPEKSVFKDQVYGVQLPGITGKFEVLNNHAPIVSALTEGRLRIVINQKLSKSFSIKSGFVEVLKNRAVVLVEGAEAI